MNLRFENYRFAEEILQSTQYKAAYAEVMDILKALPALRRGVPPSNKPPSANFPVDQDSMNRHLDTEFRKKGWSYHPPVVKGTKLAADYSKGDVQVEVQFGNMARWTYDIFKFQIAYSKGKIRIGILVVPVQWFARMIGDNIAYFERVKRELPHAELSITLPILVVGLEPTDDSELATLRERFEKQAKREAAAGQGFVVDDQGPQSTVHAASRARSSGNDISMRRPRGASANTKRCVSP